MSHIYIAQEETTQPDARKILDLETTNPVRQHSSCQHTNVVLEMHSALVNGQTAIGYYENDGDFITIELKDVPLLCILACKRGPKLTWIIQFLADVHKAFDFHENRHTMPSADPPTSPQR